MYHYVEKLFGLEKKEPFEFTTGVVGYPLLFVLLIWIVYWFEIRFGFDFNRWGVYPRTLKGLRGIVFSPFIHSGIKHLFSNTVPLLVLSMSLFYFYRKISWQILLYGLLLAGIITWLIGRPSYHIGASGVIYMLAAFLFFKGIFSKYYRLIALSLIVVFLYGGMLWFVTPVDPEISWEGHLSGLISGLLFSLIYRKKIARAPKYEWEKETYKEEEDSFMRHFDKDGNFIEHLPDQESENGHKPGDDEGPEYIYHYRKGD